MVMKFMFCRRGLTYFLTWDWNILFLIIVVIWVPVSLTRIVRFFNFIYFFIFINNVLV
jgi:hypothetical protein